MSAVRRVWEPEEMSSPERANEREVMVTRFPDTRVPFLDDLVVKLDGMRSAVEGVVEGVVSSLLPFLHNPHRHDDDPSSWSSDEVADPYPVEVFLVPPDND